MVSPLDRPVDAHAHVFRPAAVSPRAVDELASPERDAPVEDLLGVLDAHGVGAAVLVPLDAHDDYVAEVLAAHPTRFAAIAVATDGELGRTGEDGVAALRRRRTGFGFSGLRTSWLGEPGQPVHRSPALPLLRHLADTGLVLWTYLPPDQLPLLAEVVRELPELPVVLNHLGFCPHGMRVDEHRRPAFDDPFPPSTLRELDTLSHYPSVSVLFSGLYALSRHEPPYPDLWPAVRWIAERFGPRRLLWASDYPWPRDVPGYRALLDLVPALLPDLDAADRSAVLGGNARRLFPHLTPSEDR